MGDLPWGHVLLIVLLDLLLIELLSLFVARAVSGDATRPGIVYGLAVLVPLVGPAAWGAWWLPRRPPYPERPRTSWTAPSLFGLSAVLFVAATFCTWLKAAGDVREQWAVSLNASPADSMAGAVATLGTALVVASLVAALRFLTWRGRIATIGVTIAAAWLIITLDTLVTVSAVDDLTTTGSNLAGSNVAAHVSAGLGLWLCITAAVVSVAAAVLTLWSTREQTGRPLTAAPVATLPTTSSPTPTDPSGDVW